MLSYLWTPFNFFNLIVTAGNLARESELSLGNFYFCCIFSQKKKKLQCFADTDMRLLHLVGSFQRFHQFPEAYESPLVNPLHVNPEMLPVARIAQDLIKLEDLVEIKWQSFSWKTKLELRNLFIPFRWNAAPSHPLALKFIGILGPSLLAVLVVWPSEQTDPLLALFLSNSELIDVPFHISGPEQVCLHGCWLFTFSLWWRKELTASSRLKRPIRLDRPWLNEVFLGQISVFFANLHDNPIIFSVQKVCHFHFNGVKFERRGRRPCKDFYIFHLLNKIENLRHLQWDSQ